MKLKCTYCEKSYHSFETFQRHQNECGEQKNIINKLLKRIESLEEKVRENTNYIQQQRRKINIVDFLNKGDNSKMIAFTVFIRKLNVYPKLLQHFLIMDFVHGFMKIIINYIEQYDISPIRCFTNKKLGFYIFEDNKWQEIIDDYELELLINSIQGKLLRQYEDNVLVNEAAGNNIMKSYFEDKQKILCNGTTSEAICKKIKRSLYDTLKEELSM